MFTYTRVALRRAWTILIGLITICALTLVSPVSNVEDLSVFKPKDAIEKVFVVGKVIYSAQSLESIKTRFSDAVEPVTICPPRVRNVVLASLGSALKIDRVQASQIFLRVESSGIWRNCTELSEAINKAIQLGPEKATDEALVKVALSQNLAWDGLSLCVIVKAESGRILLSGNRMRCSKRLPHVFGDRKSLGDDFALLTDKITSDIVFSARSTAKLAFDVLEISLNHRVYGAIDRLTACSTGDGHCRMARPSNPLRTVSTVVLDSQEGRLLGGSCQGELCAKHGRKDDSFLPAMLFEVPPASVAKLLFALALAQDPRIDKVLLQRQIKTSGQIDGNVSKRNEWWERTVICDSRPGTLCGVPGMAFEIATELGWNANCVPTSYRCGRISLFEKSNLDTFPGQIGRLPLLATTFSPNQPMISWNDYEAVRVGKSKQMGGKAYENTSLSVQSVIGAGDMRVSALGLANLSMQIWRVANSLPTVEPKVVVPIGSESDKSISRMQDRNGLPRASAVTVLGGMQKVVEPKENGWEGAGTGFGAWMNEMGRPCNSNCGIWMKTGTVSRQDHVFGGTTTTTMLVDTDAWAKWANQTIHPSLQGKILAIGVIAVPHRNGNKRHEASYFGMTLIREMLSTKAEPL